MEPDRVEPGSLPPLTPFEIHTGVVLGERHSRRSASEPPVASTNVRGVLSDLLAPRLESVPCFLGFSGGRDSAALLSLATHLARERGLHDPIPVTLRFENRLRTDETDWQEMTIDHLGIRQWEILSIGDELDPLSPVATGLLRRHGLFWPPVAHRIVPLFEAARGHILVLGTGGDEMFSPWARHLARERLSVRGHPVRKAARRMVFNRLPERLRIYLHLRRRKDFPWLRASARREVERRYREMLRQRSGSWAEVVRRVPDSRNFELTQSIFAAMGRDSDVSLVQPFFDSRFIRAIGESAPRQGFPSRAAAMQLHFGDVLHPRVIERTTKAVFDELHAGSESRAFAEAWDGTGVDATWVDPEALRREWLSPRPEYRSLTALNAAWLASAEARA